MSTASAETAAATARAAPRESLRAGAPPSSPAETTPYQSLGEIARAYRNDARTQLATAPEKGELDQSNRGEEVSLVTAEPIREPALTVEASSPAAHSASKSVPAVQLWLYVALRLRADRDHNDSVRFSGRSAAQSARRTSLRDGILRPGHCCLSSLGPIHHQTGQPKTGQGWER